MKNSLWGFAIGIVVGVAGTLFVDKVWLRNPPIAANAFGRFFGELTPKWLDDGREMELTSDFGFVDPNQKVWLAPTGSKIDGASIPPALWSIVGGPFEGKYRTASVVHDVACEERTESSDDVHLMFYFACRCAGVEEAKAKLMYYAVLYGGPQWKVVRETKMLDGVPVTVSKAVAEEAGKPLTTEELQVLQAYIKEKNPPLPALATLEVQNGDVIEAAPPDETPEGTVEP